MSYGYMGTDLEVDLSQGKIEKVQHDPKLAETYLGGKGTNAKLLWDRVPPEVLPFSAESLFIVGAGLLDGTIVPSANHTCITFKSPVTEMHNNSDFGGFFGPELKHAGYDTIIISGKSPAPVYLWIKDDHVEIRDAGHLWGKDTHETQRLIREELKIDEAQIMCIGQAGENRVFTASIEHGTGASASRAGVGAVMGDKKLKAIAVYGTKDINVTNPSKLIELCEQILSRTGPVRKERIEPYGRTIVGPLMKFAAFGNFGEPLSPELRQIVDRSSEWSQDFMETKRVREVACYNCGLRCKHTYPRPDGGYSFIKCGSWMSPMANTRIVDLDFNMTFYNLCEKYGLDTWSVPNQIAFAIDLYEKGILTKEDTDGIHLEWGKPEVVFALLEKIVRREGIGDVLANGVYRAARQIGKGAADYAMTIKKQETIPFDLRGTKAIAEAICDRADRTRFDNGIFTRVWPRSKEDREAYLKTGFFPYPKEYEKYLLADLDYSLQNVENVLQLMAYDEENFALIDSTGLCLFWVGFWDLPPINSRPLIAELISSVTGMDVDEAEATKMAKRIVNLVRAYSVREWIRRKDDMIAERFFHRPLAKPYAPLDHALFNKWLDRWYEIRGWNKDGIPAKETLEELGLEYVRQDLEQRGILTD